MTHTECPPISSISLPSLQLLPNPTFFFFSFCVSLRSLENSLNYLLGHPWGQSLQGIRSVRAKVKEEKGGKKIQGGVLSSWLQIENLVYFSVLSYFQKHYFEVLCLRTARRWEGANLSIDSFQCSVSCWSKFVPWLRPPLDSWGMSPDTCRHSLENPE